MLRIFFAVPDFYPPWRLDVDELFAIQLTGKGLYIVWSCRRDKPGRCGRSKFRAQEAHLPLRLPLPGALGKIANKFTQYVCELGLFANLLFGRRYEVIQVRDRRYLFAFLGWLAARIRGSRFVFWSSYPFPEHLLEQAKVQHGLRRGLSWLRGQISSIYVYRFVMPLADHVFVQSEQMRRDIAAYGLPMSRMTPVPMGVPPRLFTWFEEQSGMEVVRGKVVYVGTFARVRRLEVIVEAFHRVWLERPHARLYMVGAGDTPGERMELEAHCRALGMSEAVVFTGFVPMEEAWRHAATAEVCLSPFYPTFVLRSASPTKLVEYLALGRPVVANDHPEQAEILQESQAGLCVPWGADGFAKGIAQLLDCPDQALSMGACGPGWVKTHRTYDRLANTVYARYQAMLEPAQ